MNKVKRFALAFLAVAALGAAGTASASAMTGAATLDMDETAGCPFTFEYDGDVPGSGAISDIEQTADCTYSAFFPIGIVDAQTDLTADFSGPGPDGTVTISGQLGLSFSAPFLGCKYNTAAVGGTGPFVGDYIVNGESFDTFTGTLKNSGSFNSVGCPSPLTEMTNVAIDGGSVFP